MENEDLQVENGHFTRIVNPLIERLIRIPFKGCELAVALFIIRKTYGFNKTQDQISLTQFEKGLTRSRQTIVTALKNLQLVNVARLVKQGTSKKQSNVWAINKYFDTWELGKTARLVKRKRGTSLMKAHKLVKTARHTKETTKNNTKDILASKDAPMVVALIDSFEEVNTAYRKWYARPPQRAACSRLIEKYGLEQVQRVVKMLPVSNQTPYFPTITTPIQLEDKWSQLESTWKKKRNEQLTGKNGLA